MLARSYDNQGEMTIMRVRVDEAGAWHFSGGPEVAPKARQDAVAPSSGAVRSTLRVGAERQTMSAFWERSDDGIAWLPWMEVGFTRMTD
jgi:hypothetical protein